MLSGAATSGSRSTRLMLHLRCGKYMRADQMTPPAPRCRPVTLHAYADKSAAFGWTRIRPLYKRRSHHHLAADRVYEGSTSLGHPSQWWQAVMVPASKCAASEHAQSGATGPTACQCCDRDGDSKYVRCWQCNLALLYRTQHSNCCYIFVPPLRAPTLMGCQGATSSLF